MSPSAATVAGVTDSVTRLVIALLVIVAAIAVVVGVIRARRGRGLPQLVITDLASVDWLDDAVTPGLSSLLRQQVRRRLREPSGPSAMSLLSTVKPDISGGLLQLQFASIGDVREIEDEVLSTQRDELTLVAGGIHALAPDRADGLIGAVSVALPPQRGLLVQPTPLSRLVGGKCQIGLTLDAGPLGRGPDASATFWSDVIANDPATEKLAQRTKLLELLEPAGKWIALHVIGENLTVQTTRRLPPGIKRRQRILGGRQEREALRAILTAQLAGYEMNRMLDKPAIALGFSDQALEDAQRAAGALPTYHRPHYIVGTLQDHCGSCYEVLQQDHLVESSEAVAATYRKKAVTAYRSAEDEFRKAEAMLTNYDQSIARAGEAQADNHDRATEILQGIRIRRLKVALHGANPRAALHEIDVDGVTATTPDQHYNAACLYSTAVAVSARLGAGRGTYRQHSVEQLADALVDRPEYSSHMLADPELALGLDPASLQKVCEQARSPEIVELAGVDRDRAVALLVGSVLPMPRHHSVTRQRAVSR